MFFAAKGAIYCVTIATVSFSRVKIKFYFYMFSRQGSPGISLVVI